MKRDSHARLDARSLAMHRLIAARLAEDPSLLAVAEDNLRRWNTTHATAYLDRWRALIQLPLPGLVAAIVEDSEDMTAMRQCSPFAGTLTEPERNRIYDEFPQ